jgi:hypothetical protein
VSISLDELQLAARNHGMPLEALRHEITRLGLHYLVTPYDIPVVSAASGRLTVGCQVERALLSLKGVPLNIRVPQQASAAAINRETLAADERRATRHRCRSRPDCMAKRASRIETLSCSECGVGTASLRNPPPRSCELVQGCTGMRASRESDKPGRPSWRPR